MAGPNRVYGTPPTGVEGALTSATSLTPIYLISRHASTGLDEATSKACERYRYPQSLLKNKYYRNTSLATYIRTNVREAYPGGYCM